MVERQRRSSCLEFEMMEKRLADSVQLPVRNQIGFGRGLLVLVSFTEP